MIQAFLDLLGWVRSSWIGAESIASLSQFQVHVSFHDHLISLHSSRIQKPHQAEDSLQLTTVSLVPNMVFSHDRHLINIL